MRGRLRVVICSVVLAVIVVAWIAEPPGGTEQVGYAVVAAAMVGVIVRELRHSP
jgi:carbon starvation protein CstA